MQWESSGATNTEKTAALAIETAQKNALGHLVISSNTGDSIEHFLNKGLEIVCVTHQIGFRNPGEDEMGQEKRQYLKDKGVKILTTTHLLGNVGRACERKFGGSHYGGIIAQTLRLLGQGTKVALEVVVMALDAGLIPYGEDIIGVGGTGRGLDTAVIIRPAHSMDIFASKIRHIICKPYDF